MPAAIGSGRLHRGRSRRVESQHNFSIVLWREQGPPGCSPVPCRQRCLGKTRCLPSACASASCAPISRGCRRARRCTRRPAAPARRGPLDRRPELVALLVDTDGSRSACAPRPTSSWASMPQSMRTDRPPAPRRCRRFHQQRRLGVAGRQPGGRARVVQPGVPLVGRRPPRPRAHSIDASFANADVKVKLLQALARW